MGNVFDLDAFDLAVAELKKNAPKGPQGISILEAFLNSLAEFRTGDGKALPLAEEILSWSAQADETLEAVTQYILAHSQLDPKIKDCLLHLVEVGTNYGMLLQRAADEKNANHDDFKSQKAHAAKVLGQLFPMLATPDASKVRDLFPMSFDRDTLFGTKNGPRLIAEILDAHDGFVQKEKAKNKQPAVVSAAPITPLEKAKKASERLAAAKQHIELIDRTIKESDQKETNCSVSGSDPLIKYGFVSGQETSDSRKTNDSVGPTTLINVSSHDHFVSRQELESYRAAFDRAQTDKDLKVFSYADNPDIQIKNVGSIKSVEIAPKSELTLESLDAQLKHTNNNIQQLATAVATLAKSLADSKS